MSEAAIKRLAESFGADLPGIPWEELEQQTGATAVEIVSDTSLTSDGQTPAGIQLYQVVMETAFKKAENAVRTIDLPWDLNTSESLKAWNEVKHETLSVSDAAFAAYESNIPFLSDEKELKMSIEQLRAIVASIYITAKYGYELHKRLVPQKIGTDPRLIIQHASEVTQAFNMLNFLFKEGLLEPLKKKEGVGLAPVVIGGIILGVVLVSAVGAFAWAMVASKKISATNKLMDDMCKKAMSTGDPDLLKACTEMAKRNDVAVGSGPSFGMDKITKYVLLGAGLYLLVMMGPSLAKAYSYKQKRELGST